MVFMKIIFLLLFVIQSAIAYTPNPWYSEFNLYQREQMEQFSYRANQTYQLLEIEDLQMIDVYYKYLFEMDDATLMLSKDYHRSFIVFLRILHPALEQNKIPKMYYPKIRKFLIAISGFNITKESKFNTNKLLWLLEYRNIEDETEAIEFLRKSLDMRRNSYFSEVLDILKIDLKYQQIEQWYEPKNIKNYEIVINRLKRQSKISQALKNQDKNASKLLLEEYKLNVEKILSSSNDDARKKNTFYNSSNHNDWLFLQFHKYKEIPEIRKILEKLNENWLVYNDDWILDEIPNEYRNSSKHQLFEVISSELGVFWKIGEINKLVLSPSIYNITQQEIAIYHKNRNFIEKQMESYKANVEHK